MGGNGNSAKISSSISLRSSRNTGFRESSTFEIDGELKKIEKEKNRKEKTVTVSA